MFAIAGPRSSSGYFMIYSWVDSQIDTSYPRSSNNAFKWSCAFGLLPAIIASNPPLISETGTNKIRL